MKIWPYKVKIFILLILFLLEKKNVFIKYRNYV